MAAQKLGKARNLQCYRFRRNRPTVRFKIGIILSIFAGLYFMLVFVAATWWQGLLLAIMLGLSIAAVGFNIEHDGGDQAI